MVLGPVTGFCGESLRVELLTPRIVLTYCPLLAGSEGKYSASGV